MVDQSTAILTIVTAVLNVLIMVLISLDEVTHYTLVFDTQQPILHTTSKMFLSVGIDSGWLKRHKNLPIKKKQLINLARHLSPAYLRIGGTSADLITFREHARAKDLLNQDSPDDDRVNFTITGDNFTDLYEFATNSKLRMIFDLNALIRLPDGTWNTENARQIINFAQSRKMDLDWQLGNEPNSYNFTFRRNVTAEQLSRDYYRLRQILNASNYRLSTLVGPEVNHIGEKNRRAEKYLKEFLGTNLTSIDFLSWHQYYLNGRTAKLPDFLNTSTLDRLHDEIESANETLNATNQKMEMWLSETSSAYSGGAPGLSNSYVAGFLWLDKLGMSARSNVAVVVRHTLYGGSYALIIGPIYITPNPDWWVSVIYKKLVSEKVLDLNVTHQGKDPKLRMYAHCTPENAVINRVSVAPAVTFYGINLDSVPAKISLPSKEKNLKIHLYVLTSKPLTSNQIQLNGKVLELKADGSLPNFNPITTNSWDAVILPNSSMVFMVVQGLEVPACRIPRKPKIMGNHNRRLSRFRKYRIQ